VAVFGLSFMLVWRRRFLQLWGGRRGCLLRQVPVGTALPGRRQQLPTVVVRGRHSLWLAPLGSAHVQSGSVVLRGRFWAARASEGSFTVFNQGLRDGLFAERRALCPLPLIATAPARHGPALTNQRAQSKSAKKMVVEYVCVTALRPSPIATSGLRARTPKPR
jgi:hypothetical protein